MNVRVGRIFLGAGCIVTGAFLPGIMALLVVSPLKTIQRAEDLSDVIQFVIMLMVVLMTITVVTNVRDSVEARRRGETSLDRLPRDATTLLTSIAAALLAHIFLVESMQSLNRLSPSLTLLATTMGTVMLILEGICLLCVEQLRAEQAGRNKGST